MTVHATTVRDLPDALHNEGLFGERAGRPAAGADLARCGHSYSFRDPEDHQHPLTAALHRASRWEPAKCRGVAPSRSEETRYWRGAAHS
jgi:hypothetical protein